MALERLGTFISAVILGALTLCSGSLAAESKSSAADPEFVRMDTNRDGKVSADEHAAGAKQTFATMDANKDGKVTGAEMKASYQRITGQKAKKSDMTAADKIKVVDKDGDGMLTAEEHAAGSRVMFEKMDTNRDGFLTKDELVAGHAGMMRRSSR